MIKKSHDLKRRFFESITISFLWIYYSAKAYEYCLQRRGSKDVCTVYARIVKSTDIFAVHPT